MTLIVNVEQYALEQRLGQTIGSVADRIAEYRAKAPETRARLDEHFHTHYGIPGFSTEVDSWWRKDTSRVALCMARQIPTFSVEGLSLHLLADWANANGLPCAATPVSFIRDCFGQHGYKDGLIKLRELTHHKGQIGVTGRPILPKEQREGITLKRPLLTTLTVQPGEYWGRRVPDGTTLIDFHYAMRHAALNGEGGVDLDVSSFFEACLRHSLRSDAPGKPDYFFVAREGYDEKVTDHRDIDLDASSLRPNAYWYYIMYLSLFTTGERVLVASLDDDDDVHAMFGVFADIEAICGLSPLILWVPYKPDPKAPLKTKKELKILFNEINPRTLRGGWRKKIELPSGAVGVYDAMEAMERQVLSLNGD
jgi:hypothetical protein